MTDRDDRNRTAGGAEPPEIRLKRLRLRSWRRGIREMDLILGGWADASLDRLGPAELDLYEALLEESDHDIYGWVAGRAAPPERFGALVARIVAEGAQRRSI